MKKTIKVLTIVSGAIVVLSMLALIICVVMQEIFIPLYTSSFDAGEYFAFPIARFVYVFGILLCSVLLFFSAGLRKLRMWAEIVASVFIGAVFPFWQWYILLMQTSFVASRGINAVGITAAVNNLASIVTCLVPIAAAVLLLVSGLSIASKVYEK